MARTTAAKKQETHERIVRTAAAAIRRGGYEGISVADIMADAGLTHGGFYAHFASRDAMLAEALDQAAGDSITRLAKSAADAGDKHVLDALVASYLSDRHLDAPEAGCTLAALGTETRRQTPEVRHVATRRFKEMVDLIERTLPGWGEPHRHDDALAIVSCMVGAMMIARLVDDPAVGKSVRKASARFIAGGAGQRGRPRA